MTIKPGGPAWVTHIGADRISYGLQAGPYPSGIGATMLSPTLWQILRSDPKSKFFLHRMRRAADTGALPTSFGLEESIAGHR
ncbi:hypothetical protein [Maritimibacter sp. 55A14]|uniref:hypothetical protein n=1 Tax=Maritimibacter sp. 55A14 TaxID=2174844 RepID=UPI0011B1EA7E|nr:hypothetical protein [Maritimibacter sp. 55A14]